MRLDKRPVLGGGQCSVWKWGMARPTPYDSYDFFCRSARVQTRLSPPPVAFDANEWTPEDGALTRRDSREFALFLFFFLKHGWETLFRGRSQQCQ